MAWTHWPAVVDAWMQTQLGSFALDTVWLGAGLVFWWPVAVSRGGPSWFGYPAMVGYLILITFLFIVINLSVDLVYALLDPRLRQGAAT